MSVLLDIDTLPLDKKRKLIADLTVKTIAKAGKKKYFSGVTFETFDVIDDKYVTVPFGYAYHEYSHVNSKEYPEMDAEYSIPLYDRQKKIRQEVFDNLNESQSIILELATGWGKCLDPDTKVLMWTGGYKHAKNIIIGDLLVGDDGRPRNVLSICQGEDIMYKISQSNGKSYTVNEPHILSLKIKNHKTWFQSDISNRYYVSYFDFSTNKMKSKPFDTLRELNIYLSTIDDNDILDISVRDYLELDEDTKFFLKGFKTVFEFPYAESYKKQIILSDIQVEYLGRGKYCGFSIDGNRRFLLEDFTVTHNTMFSIYLACKIKLKTIIFYHRIVIGDQWKNSIIKACGEDARVQMLTAKTKIDKDADFYIINVINVHKRDRKDFEHIGTIIVDEAHTICTEKFSKSLSYVFPKYFLACTATPVRSDGLDRIIELYAGTNIISRPLKSLFNVYVCYSGFIPSIETTENGDMIWGSVLKSQMMDMEYNKLIVDIARYFKTRSILIACKLKNHASVICEGLKKYGEYADTYMGSQRVVNYDCRVLTGTTSKCGVGFDMPKLDMLIVAGDMEEGFMQLLGRIFRREHHLPIVVEFRSKFRPLNKHLDSRLNICTEVGGQIKNLENYFPEFVERRKKFNTDLRDVYEQIKFSEEE